MTRTDMSADEFKAAAATAYAEFEQAMVQAGIEDSSMMKIVYVGFRVAWSLLRSADEAGSQPT